MTMWSFPVLITYAALRDMFSFTIPNGISLTLLCGYFLVTIAEGNFWSYAMLSNISAGVVVLIVVAILFYRSLLGGGDAKLIAVVSMWMGWSNLLPFLMFMSLAGGVLAFVWLIAKRLAGSKLMPPWANHYFSSTDGLPYGIAIATAGVAVFFSLDWPQTGLLNVHIPEPNK